MDEICIWATNILRAINDTNIMFLHHNSPFFLHMTKMLGFCCCFFSFYCTITYSKDQDLIKVCKLQAVYRHFRLAFVYVAYILGSNICKPALYFYLFISCIFTPSFLIGSIYKKYIKSNIGKPALYFYVFYFLYLYSFLSN